MCSILPVSCAWGLGILTVAGVSCTVCKSGRSGLKGWVTFSLVAPVIIAALELPESHLTSLTSDGNVIRWGRKKPCPQPRDPSLVTLETLDPYGPNLGTFYLQLL